MKHFCFVDETSTSRHSKDNNTGDSVSGSKSQQSFVDPLSQSLPTHRMKQIMADSNTSKKGGRYVISL